MNNKEQESWGHAEKKVKVNKIKNPLLTYVHLLLRFDEIIIDNFFETELTANFKE